MSSDSVRAFLALGSNLGDRLAFLQQAVASLPDLVGCSRVYETEPIGGPLDQGAYLNAVVELRTTRTPGELLEAAQAVESAAGRVRKELNGPRTLDVDLLLYGDTRVNEPDLLIPHPRMWERRFVLAPLRDLAPELLPEDWETHVLDGSVETTTFTLVPKASSY